MAQEDDVKTSPETLIPGADISELLASLDGPHSPLGPAEHWPQALKRAVGLLAARERRQGFLLSLGDRLRGTEDAQVIMAEASRSLGEFLSVSQVGFGEVDEGQALVTVHRDWNDGRLPSVVGGTGFRLGTPFR